jgi:hypothetical protein
MKWSKVLLKIAGVFVAVLVLGGVALVAMVRWEHGRQMTLPKPTGRFAVGRTSFTWVNDALTDDLAPIPGDQADGVRMDVVPRLHSAATSTGGVPAAGVALCAGRLDRNIDARIPEP